MKEYESPLFEVVSTQIDDYCDVINSSTIKTEEPNVSNPGEGGGIGGGYGDDDLG